MMLLFTGCCLFPNEEEKQEARRVEEAEVLKKYEERSSSKDTGGRQDLVTGECDTTEGIDAPLVDDCITADVSCGDTITGHTTGGAKGWNEDFYLAHYCMPMPKSYEGSERVYRLVAPADSTIRVELDSPCGDLDLFLVHWSGRGCPTKAHTVGTCDSDVSNGDGQIELYQDRTPRTYLVAVDGKGDVEAPFTLNVSCHERE